MSLPPQPVYLTRDLMQTGKVTLDGSGNGTIPFFVGGYEIWEITGAALTTTQSLTATQMPQVLFYRGQPLPANAESASYQGNYVTFSGLIRLYSAEYLTVALNNGVPASVATVTLRGTIKKRIA